ncbi:MAG: putative quinol monooxygenase [Pseudomonadota bacterium]
MTFAVCVTFQINPEYWDAFLDLMRENAAASLKLEAGCLQFDVCTDASLPYEVFLYEIYKSSEAFEAHLNSEHFRDFDVNVTKMIKDKQVKTYTMVN